MFKSLFASRRPAPHAPPVTCLYAIGDVHGRLDLLETLTADIVADAQAYQGFRKVLITLGDYIDRGPDSRGVIDMLRSGPPPEFEMVNLMGNHEDLFLRFLERPSTISTWVMNGGDATLASYGIQLPADWAEEETAARLRDELRDAVPQEHLQFLRELGLYHVEGDYMFAHAGIRPGLEPHEQSQVDLIWIRDEFLRSKRNHGKVVVHGHSVSYAPEIWPSEKRPSRIGIDTGAYLTDRLTCLSLVGSELGWIQTEPNERFA